MRSMTAFVLWENAPLYKEERGVFINEPEIIDGCDVEAFESSDFETKAMAVGGSKT